MKKIFLIILVAFFVGGCTNAQPDSSEIENDIIFEENEPSEESEEPILSDVNESEIHDDNNEEEQEPEVEAYFGPLNALISATFTSNIRSRFETEFDAEFNGYQAINPKTINNYERVIVFYNQSLENSLRDAGYDWPELKPEEAIRIQKGDVEWIFVNHSNTRFRMDTIDLFLNHHELIDQEIISLTSFYPNIETDLSALVHPEFCKIEDQHGETVRVGFPNAPSRLPNNGLVTVQVLFIDFPDQEGTQTDSQLKEFFEDYIEGIERFYDNQSLSQVQFDWRLEPGFVRIPRNFSELRMTRGNSEDLDPVLRQAIQISDDNIDYTDIDMVIVFLNPDIPEELADVSPAWPLEGMWGIQTSEKTIYNATFIAGDAVRIGYSIIAHEIGHLFGLIDLYKFNWLEDNPERDYERQFDFVGVFDFMNLAPPSHEFGDNRDMLGWQRFLLNWITDEEIHCLNNDEASLTYHLLSPVSEEGGNRMVVTRLSKTQVLVTEVRAENQYCELCSGGVYHYLVDTSLRNGHGAIQLLRPEHSTMKLFQDAYITQGQSFTYENVTVHFDHQRRDQVVVSIEIKDQ